MKNEGVFKYVAERSTIKILINEGTCYHFCKYTNAAVWSSELNEYRWDSYTGIPKRHIVSRRIEVRWYDNTMYSDRNQNIMPVVTMHAIELSHVL